MSAPARLAAFTVALLAVFGAGLGLGAAAGPFDGDADRREPPVHVEHP